MGHFADKLLIVDKAFKYTTNEVTSLSGGIPEFCSNCGKPMRVKSDWTRSGWDPITGEPCRYEALIVCSEKKIWRPLAFHDEKLLVYTPAKFTVALDKKKRVPHLTTLVRRGF